MKKLLLILSLGLVFSCTKNDTAQNKSGETMKLDSSSNVGAKTSRTTDGTSMRDSATTTIPNGTSATPGTSPSTPPSSSSDSVRSSR